VNIPFAQDEKGGYSFGGVGHPGGERNMENGNDPQSGAGAAEAFQTFLPEDINTLCEYLAVLRQLMDEKAWQVGENWETEVSAQSELEALLLLEERISGRVAGIRSHSLADVLGKFRIWDMLMEADGDEDTALRDQVIRSIRCDIEQLSAAGGGPGPRPS
jgi:hypothetical protein